MEDMVVAFLHTSVYPQSLHVHLVPWLGAMQVQALRTLGARCEWEVRLESLFLLCPANEWNHNDGNWVTILAWWGRYQEHKEHCLSL